MNKTLKLTGLALILAGASLLPQRTRAETIPDYAQRMYSKGFTHTNEMSNILFHSKRIGVDHRLLMAIRESENGKDPVAYGIIPEGQGKVKYANDTGYDYQGKKYPYQDVVEKQMCWSAWTIKKRTDEFNSLDSKQKSKYSDIVDYIGSKYCPVGVKNDPTGLNGNWKGNVRAKYENFK